MKPALTRRQQEVYDFLREQAADLHPSPSLEELCRAMDLNSRGSLHKHIRALVEAGLVEPMSRGRGIRLAAGADAPGHLPFLGYIAAGRPIEAVVDPREVEIPAWLRGARPCYVLEVRGESMVDEGILDGDRVVVESRDHARNGEIVVALVDGREATLKRIEQRPGKTVLHPANAAMAPLEFAPERVAVQGVVTGLLRSYR